MSSTRILRSRHLTIESSANKEDLVKNGPKTKNPQKNQAVNGTKRLLVKKSSSKKAGKIIFGITLNEKQNVKSPKKQAIRKASKIKPNARKNMLFEKKPSLNGDSPVKSSKERKRILKISTENSPAAVPDSKINQTKKINETKVDNAKSKENHSIKSLRKKASKSGLLINSVGRLPKDKSILLSENSNLGSPLSQGSSLKEIGKVSFNELSLLNDTYASLQETNPTSSTPITKSKMAKKKTKFYKKPYLNGFLDSKTPTKVSLKSKKRRVSKEKKKEYEDDLYENVKFAQSIQMPETAESDDSDSSITNISTPKLQLCVSPPKQRFKTPHLKEFYSRSDLRIARKHAVEYMKYRNLKRQKELDTALTPCKNLTTSLNSSGKTGEEVPWKTKREHFQMDKGCSETNDKLEKNDKYCEAVSSSSVLP